ncbi:MAG TPA: ABC transporter permease [Acidimicrobiales bacterium]|nr:ABC transporter permease [Acidimicrobiales bacterium]
MALGSITLDDLDLSLGDTVEVTSFTRGDTFEMTVVGTTIVNDNFEASPGRGAAVTEGFIDQAAPEVGGDPAVLSLGPGADVAEVAATLREVTEAPVVEPLRQSAIRNVGRIRGLPLVVAAVIGLLALASLTHALLLSTRLNRRQLGMLKTLGFTRRQVATTVAVEATSFALLATAVGLPLGVIIGRWGWRLVAEGLGVPAVPIVPVLLLVGVVAVALAVANLAAAYPAWRAARLPTAVALRSE